LYAIVPDRRNQRLTPHAIELLTRRSLGGATWDTTSCPVTSRTPRDLAGATAELIAAAAIKTKLLAVGCIVRTRRHRLNRIDYRLYVAPSTHAMLCAVQLIYNTLK